MHVWRSQTRTVCNVKPQINPNYIPTLCLQQSELEKDIQGRKEQAAFVEKLVDELFTNNENVSTRQIPAWFRFRKQLPMTANSKINYAALAEESLLGTEISVSMEESNISVESISIK